jgi:hypothetical protein
MSPLLHHLEIETIKDDDDAIAAALADVSVPALMASVVQITGDPSYLRGSIRPREFVMNEFQGKMSEEEKDEADGYLHTIVSGIEVYADGQPTGQFPGKLVRGEQQPSKAKHRL